MRTVTLILGLLFLECLSKHWGVDLITASPDNINFLSTLCIGCIILDVCKK